MKKYIKIANTVDMQGVNFTKYSFDLLKTIRDNIWTWQSEEARKHVEHSTEYYEEKMEYTLKDIDVSGDVSFRKRFIENYSFRDPLVLTYNFKRPIRMIKIWTRETSKGQFKQFASFLYKYKNPEILKVTFKVVHNYQIKQPPIMYLIIGTNKLKLPFDPAIYTKMIYQQPYYIFKYDEIKITSYFLKGEDE
jgi:hypothetical protein